MATLFIALGTLLFTGTVYAVDDIGPRLENDSFSSRGQFIKCDPGAGQDCTFQHIYQLIKTVIDFLLFTIMTPLAIIALVFAGIKYVTAQGNPGELQKAHQIFYYVVIGMLIALAAWLIINTIISELTGNEPGTKYNFLSN